MKNRTTSAFPASRAPSFLSNAVPLYPLTAQSLCIRSPSQSPAPDSPAPQLASKVLSFIYENLDAATRGAMIAELDGDMLGGGAALSPRLTPEGAERYPALLRAALTTGSPATFAAALAAPGVLRRVDPRAANAAQLIADCEFNRYYIRGVCSRVLTEGGTHVRVYRARPSAHSRAASQAKVGTLLDAEQLLDDLRRHPATEPAILPEINSGLSVRIPD